MGVYEIDIELSDIYLQSYYTMILRVLPSSEVDEDTVVEEFIPGTITASLDSLNRYGLAEISFSEPILIPAVYPEFFNLTVLELSVLRNN